MTHATRTAILSAAIALLLPPGATSAIADRGRPVPASHALLDVPYVPQTEALCGGAAVAMVMRYWGERDVFAEDFARLVNRDRRGIQTDRLASEVRSRGWQALARSNSSAPIDDEDLSAQLGRGRPVIVLIGVSPETYHYVVIVGATRGEIVLHDPARAPFRVLSRAEFERAWTAAGRWMLLVLPPGGVMTARTRRDAPTTPAGPRDLVGPCEDLVDKSVARARAGDANGAETGLTAAIGLCPDHAPGWRELAGLRFTASRWHEARNLAARAVALAPQDTYAWQLLATSRYLDGDRTGALDAWNRVGQPHVGAVDVQGASRTRYPVVTRAVGLVPRRLLTSDAFQRAARRLADLPVAANTRVGYVPADDGSAQVEAVIDERDVIPKSPIDFVSLGARALTLDEVQVDVAGPTGGGEIWNAAWRWPGARPRVAFRLAIPGLGGFPGVVALEGSWERQSYAAGSGPNAPAVIEQRRQAGLSLADWATGWLHWQAGGAFDHLRERAYVAVHGALDVRLAADRISLGVDEGWWTPFAGGSTFSSTDLSSAWRSTLETTQPVWSGMAGLSAASGGAPLALWPGAGTGQGRAVLLRAHPLLDANVVKRADFGRRLVYASLEYEHPLRTLVAGRVAIAGFVDAARAAHRLNDAAPTPFLADIGAGVRLHVPGMGGTIRLDVARGLRDGRVALSAGWTPRWPKR